MYNHAIFCSENVTSSEKNSAYGPALGPGTEAATRLFSFLVFFVSYFHYFFRLTVMSLLTFVMNSLSIKTFVLLFLIFCSTCLAFEYCPAKACSNEQSEIERWDCVGKYLFEQHSNERFVLHPCQDLGWGNGITAMLVSAQLALAMNSRLVFARNFTHLWELPGATPLPLEIRTNRVRFDYEKDGRSEDSYKNWINGLKETKGLDRFNKKLVDSGMCGMDIKLVKNGECLTEALTVFGKCIDRVQDMAVNMPVYYNVFKKPTKRLVDMLAQVRERLALPQLEPGLEPKPGQWGLYTPGYYLFALHFRMIPLGFEPLSVMLNEKQHLESQINELKEFWDSAKRLAKQARALADCRNETLLIYFATDDVENLRARATKRLGRFGRVVFGLSEDEVGHSSPQWTSMSMRQVDERQAVVLEEKAAAEKARKCTAEAAMTGKCERPARPAGRESKVSVVRTARDAEATEKHRDMALLEWWILANAQVSARNAPQGLTTAAWLASIRVHPHASWPRPGSVTADAHKSIRIASFVTVDEHKHAWFAGVRPCRAANPARLVRETPRAWEPSAAAPSAVSVFRSR